VGSTQRSRDTFDAWRNASPHHGRKVVVLAARPERPIVLEQSLKEDFPCEIAGVTREQFNAFLKVQQQCEGVCFAVKSILDSALLANHQVVVTAPSNPAKINGVLERVDVYEATAPISLNCMIWFAPDLQTASTYPLFTFASERVLAKSLAHANHMVLKLAIRNTFNDKLTVAWLDPTAQQLDPSGMLVKAMKDCELGDHGYSNVNKAYTAWGCPFDSNGTLAPWVRTVGRMPLQYEVACNQHRLPFHVCVDLVDAWKELVNELSFLKVPWMKVEDFIDQEQD
jgi:hypothetical protein